MTPSKDEVVEEFRVHTIQEAALRVFARKGLDAATMQEIADEAGIAKGTIYLYFRNRESLLAQTVEFAVGQLLTRLEAVFQEAGGFDAGLRRFLKTTLEFFQGHQELFRLYLAVSQGGDRRGCDRPESPQKKILFARLAEFFSAAMDRGEIRRMDPARVALFFSEGLMAVTQLRIREESSPAPADDIEWIASLMELGLRNDRREA